MIEDNKAYASWREYEDEQSREHFGPEPPDEGYPDEDPRAPEAEHSATPETTAREALDRAVTALEAELLDSAELDMVPSLKPLIEGFLYRDTIARMIGPSGHMKSFIMLDFAGHIGCGIDWRGHRVDQGLVIYLVAEGAGGIRKRVRAWEQHHGRTMDSVKFLPRPVQVKDAIAWGVLTELCKRLEPVFIIFDTQARVTVGTEENSAKEMGTVVQRLEDLRAATSACVALVHHQGLQGEHGRGSTAVKGALQTELRVSKKGKGELTRITVSSDKQKDDEELPDVVFAIQVVKLNGEAKEDGTPVTSVVLVPAEPVSVVLDESKRPPAMVKILEALEECAAAVTSKGIVDAIVAKHGHGLTRETVSKSLNALSAEGVVERIEESPNQVYWQLLRRPEDL